MAQTQRLEIYCPGSAARLYGKYFEAGFWVKDDCVPSQITNALKLLDEDKIPYSYRIENEEWIGPLDCSAFPKQEPSSDCYYCVLKHLGQAAVLAGEVADYPLHAVLAYGHMAEAERETGSEQLRVMVREARVLWMEAEQEPDWMDLFQEALDAKAT